MLQGIGDKTCVADYESKVKGVMVEVLLSNGGAGRKKHTKGYINKECVHLVTRSRSHLPTNVTPKDHASFLYFLLPWLWPSPDQQSHDVPFPTSILALVSLHI